MSSPCHTLSPHETLLAKTKDPREEEAEKRAREEAEHLACEEATKKVREEAARLAEEACRVQEEAEKKEREERETQEAAAREEAAKRVAEAAEERADACGSGRMTVADPSAPGQRASGVQDPCARCHNKGTLCVLGAAKGKTTVCKACRHTKVSCSWMKKTAGKTHKWKQVQCLEEMEGREVIDVDADNDKDEEQSYFAVLTHLAEEHRDALRALMTTLNTLSMEFYEFRRDYWGFGTEVLKVMDTIVQELRRANDLKEEEMGKAKGKGKEKAQEEFRRARTEDDDRDMEMGETGSLA
ncbi:hypothetical protein ID866_11125 [Astraeus odoratus]|nr:hypothetical protein ID866_11125 [Astraeus odoratus]